MEILKVKKIEDCLEGKNVWDLLLEKPITKGFIYHLGLLGKMIYQDFFPKPFFTLIVKGRFTIKGSEQNQTIRLLLPDDADSSKEIEELRKYFKMFVE
ncbi:MAG: hypothetical protein N2319_09760 [Candidatus Kapabacteria bacterium]|nr:hypothetical protein [Candidatus Kapabacteria bacterium]